MEIECFMIRRKKILNEKENFKRGKNFMNIEKILVDKAEFATSFGEKNKFLKNIFFFQIPNFDGSKLHHDLVFPHKSLPIPLLQNLEEIQQKEAFLQELQNQITGKSKRTSPLASSPVLSTPIPPSPLLPFLPYLQHPYVPLPPSDTPWNLQQQEVVEKKPEPHPDTPLNLTKPKSDDHSVRNASNDGNNNKSQNFDHAGSSKLLPTPPPRHPYNLPRFENFYTIFI